MAQRETKLFQWFDGQHGLIDIESGRIIQGHLPNTAYELVNKWRLIHLQELRADWNLARQNQPVLPIEPLE